jgi:carbon-monoxide dehydrogenase medium subunit
MPANTGCFAYLKYRQPASGFAVVGVAAIVTLDRRGNCERVRVGITGLGAKAFLAKAVESALAGKAPDAANLAAAAAHAAEGIDHSRISTPRRISAPNSRVYTRRALATATSKSSEFALPTSVSTR